LPELKIFFVARKVLPDRKVSGISKKFFQSQESFCQLKIFIKPEPQN
jgi:hypothetical protein